jgi:hypothetical protein
MLATMMGFAAVVLNRVNKPVEEAFASEPSVRI